MSRHSIEVLSSLDALNATVLQAFVDLCKRSVAERGVGQVVFRAVAQVGKHPHAADVEIEELVAADQSPECPGQGPPEPGFDVGDPRCVADRFERDPGGFEPRHGDGHFAA